MRKPLLCLLFLSLISLLMANSFSAKDTPWDDGKSIDLSWELSPMVKRVEISRQNGDEPARILLNTAESSGSFTDNELQPNNEYHYQLKAFFQDDDLTLLASAQTKEQWFYMGKLGFLILLLIICIAIIYYIHAARAGKEFFIRRIAGLDCMEEAIGRATEKGKPILYVPGISDLDDIQTIASLTILSHLAERTAEYDTEIIVPCRFSMVLSAAKEVVREAYIKAGRLDAYKADNIFYLTDDQFGFVAGIDGIMLRRKPAANFFMGSFYAESLILAETGFATGAIQTAGTAQAHQLPFFVVTCDYTLIGEELFAASAYLSKDPQQLGSLKGHDFGKLLIILLIVVGVILEILGVSNLKEFIAGAIS
ncbi:MAG: hypothetical protein RBR69_08025 [Candidatus Cloacimonadaceae bacterium]|jgi:hypothetical protein|nr:hypothetical protein [Candidatus Cloacimonadota bacterium]MCK9178539.1 hypothetical protein [Candidatus Cloacimonadota bacterium]MDY0128063.1 hypothetical protein [Candidatus Cloacimonadaceae bacterium]